MIEILSNPWPWYVSGPLISLVMFLLLWIGGVFGVSSTLKVLCSICGAGKKVSFFDFDWKSDIWKIVFIVGAIIGGFIAHQLLNSQAPLLLSEATVNDLNGLNISFTGGLAPLEFFSWEALLT